MRIYKRYRKTTDKNNIIYGQGDIPSQNIDII